MNLLFMFRYDPSMPLVMLICRDGELGVRKVVFIDNIHGSAKDRFGELSKQAHWYLEKHMNYYANQEAAQKCWLPSLHPWAQNGIIINCGQEYPVKSTTLKKWTCRRDSLAWLWTTFGLGRKPNPVSDIKACPSWEVNLDTSELCRIFRLWVHFTKVYTKGRCFFKGFVNSMEAFWYRCDING